MVKHKRRVIWDEDARANFKQAIAHIKKNSLQNAEKIKKEILVSTNSLINEPERLHAPDKYRMNNDGSYRAYEIHKFRVSYFVGKDNIRIIRFRHVSQEPQTY